MSCSRIIFNHEGNWWKIVIFECLVDTESRKCEFRLSFLNLCYVDEKSLSRLSLTPSTECVIIGVTCRVDFSTHSGFLYKPSWGPTNRGKVQQQLSLKWVCNNPRPFLFQFPGKSWFWWSRQGDGEYSEFDVFKRSGVMSRCAKMPGTRSGVL